MHLHSYLINVTPTSQFQKPCFSPTMYSLYFLSNPTLGRPSFFLNSCKFLYSLWLPPLIFSMKDLLGLTRIDTLIGTLNHHKKNKSKKNKPFRAFPSGESATLHPVLPTISLGSKKPSIISLKAHDFVLPLNAPWTSLGHVRGTYSWCPLRGTYSWCPSTSWVYQQGPLSHSLEISTMLMA